MNRKFTNRSKNKTPGRFATEVITRDVAHGLRIAASFTHERELDHLLHTTRLAA